MLDSLHAIFVEGDLLRFVHLSTAYLGVAEVSGQPEVTVAATFLYLSSIGASCSNYYCSCLPMAPIHVLITVASERVPG